MAGRSRRRTIDDRQLALADWSPKECQSTRHKGNPLIPVDQFVRNGPYLRTVCRACWAEANRCKRGEERPEGISRDAFIDINKLWRPPADQSASRGRFSHRRAGSGAS